MNYTDDDGTTKIQKDNTEEGKRELLDQITEILRKTQDETNAADEKSRITLRIFTKRC